MSPTLMFVFLLLVDSLHFVFAKLLLPHGNPETMGMIVLLVGTFEIGVYAIITKKLDFTIFKENIFFFLAIGFCIAVSLVINYSAVSFIDPGTGTFISQTGTLWGIVFGVIWLKDSLDKYKIIGALVVISGVFIMKYHSANLFQIGTGMVLFSTFIYSLHTALSKRFGDNIDFINFFFFRLFSTLLVLVIINFASKDFSLPTSTGWKLALLVGTIDVVISRTLFYLTLRKLKLSIHTIALTISPLVAIIWAYLLFKDIPTAQQLIGGGFILIGMLIVNYKSLFKKRRFNSNI
jgi:drug/metabolite transporter (DMT)-like permease